MVNSQMDVHTDAAIYFIATSHHKNVADRRVMADLFQKNGTAIYIPLVSLPQNWVKGFLST